MGYSFIIFALPGICLKVLAGVDIGKKVWLTGDAGDIGPVERMQGKVWFLCSIIRCFSFSVLAAWGTWPRVSRALSKHMASLVVES